MNNKLRTICRGRFPVLDFDKTMARTDLPSPNGHTVASAYALALDRISGIDGLLHKLGGFENQAPGELAVLAHGHGNVYGAAVSYYRRNRDALEALMQNGKGVSLSESEKRGHEIDFLTELLVRAKLSILLGEVSAGWPRPVDGMRGFLGSRWGKGYGVITSGHDEFVMRTLSAWGAPLPAVMLTDDDMRNVPLPVEMKTKPSQAVMESWRDRARRKRLVLAPDDIVFGGDDLRTDCGLAQNSGTWGVWYNPDDLPGDPGERCAIVRHIDELTEAFA